MKEYFIRCLVAKSLPWSLIQAVHHHLYLLIRYESKSFYEVLANKAIGVFTEPTLTCMIKVCELHRTMYLLFDRVMVGEFLSVISSDGKHLFSLGFRRSIAALATRSIRFFGNFPSKVNLLFLSTRLSNASWCFFPMMVSIFQSPMCPLSSTAVTRLSKLTGPGTQPR